MTYPTKPKPPAGTSNARALRQLLARVKRARVVAPRAEIGEALAALVRQAAADPGTLLTVEEERGTITIRLRPR